MGIYVLDCSTKGCTGLCWIKSSRDEVWLTLHALLQLREMLEGHQDLGANGLLQ